MVSDKVFEVLITGISTVVVAIPSIIGAVHGVMNRKEVIETKSLAIEAVQAGRETKSEVRNVANQMDGMLTKRVDAARSEGIDIGEGRSAQRYADDKSTAAITKAASLFSDNPSPELIEKIRQYLYGEEEKKHEAPPPNEGL